MEHRWAQDQGTARTTYCFLKTTWGHKLIPHNRSHLPPAKGLEEAHHPLYPAGTRLLSQAAKPERLARARRSKTFQLTSSMSPSAPAIAQCPPLGLPVSTARPAPPRARHCREARRPEVSSQADVALAPWPLGRRRDSPRRACECRARQPVSPHPESFLGREIARCFAAAVKRGGGRPGRGRHGGGPAA